MSDLRVRVRRSRRSRTRTRVLGHKSLLAVCLLAATSSADTLTLTDNQGVVSGRVSRITADRVILEEQEAVARSNMARVAFAAMDVTAYPAGVILTDGTTLGGAFRALKSDQVLFRSVTFGQISFPLSELAAIYFAGTRPEGTGFKAPPSGAWRITLTNGVVREGTMVAMSPQSIVLRADKSLEKIPMESVTCIVRAAPAGRTPVALRNGDRIGNPVWSEAGLTARIGSQSYPVGVSLLKDVQLTEAR